MGKCVECAFFFSVPQNAEDYEPGKGDCVTEHKDEKGKFWQSKPVFEGNEVCRNFSKN